MSVTDNRRRCGVLLPVTALPDSPGNGDFDGAMAFIDWLTGSGASIWQLLPMGVPLDSPYLSLSAHAGDPELIGLNWLQQQGFGDLPKAADENTPAYRYTCLSAAQNFFTRHGNVDQRGEYRQFLEESHYWLDDYARFIAFREARDKRAWCDWETPLRDRHPQALAEADNKSRDAIEKVKFNQFLFFKQWREIHRYAQQQGILLFGDMPLFVAHDSADVWANRDYFRLTDDGHTDVVAGVPPDYFSATGQRWGNPHYHWKAMEQDGFRWWLERLRTQLRLYDQVRLDHFRGLCAAWEIPAGDATAENGAWRPAPGAALLVSLRGAFGELPLIAEDLGIITPDVTELRHQFALPGMAILQFAFDSGADNPYLPHNLEKHCVIYTGTHDNDTSLGWFTSQSEEQRQRITRYLRSDNMPHALVEAALASVADWSIIPLQDLLGLGSEHRINTPGTTEGNWRWRFTREQLTQVIADNLREMNTLYGRC